MTLFRVLILKTLLTFSILKAKAIGVPTDLRNPGGRHFLAMFCASLGENTILPNYLTPEDFERARLPELEDVNRRSNWTFEECGSTSTSANYNYPSRKETHEIRTKRSISDDSGFYGSDIINTQEKMFFSEIIKTPDEIAYENKILTWKKQMWPNGRVPYTLNANLNSTLRALVAKAIDNYHSKTCIRFEAKQDSDVDYVDIMVNYDLSDVCGRADICRRGGRQTATFAPKERCFTFDTMIHELGHTLCRNHEFGRPDRDQYLNTGKVCNKKLHEVIISNHDWLTDDLFYDYLSNAHYSSYCTQTCFLPKMPGVDKCNSIVLSVLDIEKLNALYDCPGCLSYRFRPISKLFKTDSEELSINDYILWQTSFFGQGKGNERENLVKAGQSVHGEKLYPCRAYHQGDIVPGRGNLLARSCQIAYKGKAFEKVTNFELLTNPKNAGLKWIEKPSNGSSLPKNVIAGGRTNVGETLYMGRCNVTDDNGRVALVPGFYTNGTTLSNLFVANGGIVYNCSTYDILVCE